MLLNRKEFMVVSRIYSMSVVVSRKLKGHSDFPTYCFEQCVHSKRYITFLHLQFDSW